MKRFGIVAIVLAALSLLAGYAFSGVLASALAIRFEDKELPPEPTTVVSGSPVSSAGPVERLGDVTVPAELTDDPLLTLASENLREAAGSRAHTDSAVSVQISVTDKTTEGYAVSRSGDTVTVTGGRQGAANGLFRLADVLAAGGDWDDVATGEQVEPVLERRFVDTGAVGVVPDVDAYLAQDDYQHTSGALGSVVLSESPWLDPEGLALVEEDWREFINHVVAYGYNGVYVPGFLEYVSFDSIGDGTEVYAPDSPERARQEAMREQVGALWQYADDMGLDVVFKTDMLALSGPLEAYLERQLGGIDANDPQLWEVYRAAFEELFTTFPWADGLMIRIGEAGAIYNIDGWDYYSALEVREPAAVQRMLRMASAVAAEHDASVYFRTWSVGIGSVGDMHTNPETYDEVLAGLDLPNLVVSTKFTMGDFDSFLPLNPTLMGGDHDRIVELQGRREFEAFSSIPNDVGPTHQAAMQRFIAENPGISGIWLWTQDGGPWRAGPMSLYLKEGFWQLYDLNVYAGGRLGWDLDVDLAEVNRAWITRMLTSDPEAVDAVAQVLSLSRSAVLDGFYIGPYAEQAVFALGLEPPPMMWIFKWDIVSGDAASLSAVYLTAAEQLDEAIAGGERAVATAQEMRALLDGVDRTTFHDPGLYDRLVESIDYEIDLFETLLSYRTAFLQFYAWLDTGSEEAKQAWLAARSTYEQASAEHVERWTGNLDHPPYAFFAADAGLVHAERTPVTQGAAWVLLAGSALALAFVPSLFRGAYTPWRLGARRGYGRGTGGPDAVGPPDSRPQAWEVAATLALPVLAVVGSRLAFSSGASTAYLLVTLGSIALLAVTARLVLAILRPGADAFPLWAALGGMLVLRTLVLSVGMTTGGPLGYWFRFWTDETGRTLYVTVAVGAFLWGLAVIALVLWGAYRVNLVASIGTVLLGIGVPLLALGGLLATLGLERSLTTLNDQMAVLPLGLSRILGLVTHLGIPRELPEWLLMGGGVLALVGALAVGITALRARLATVP